MVADELLAPHFARSEFEVSATRPDLVERIPAALLDHARRLARDVLEPLRTDLARPVRILSGYRAPRLNAAVGGSPTSQHARAEAVDVTVAGVSVGTLLRHLMRRAPQLPTGQVIGYPDRGFVHLALPSRTYRTPAVHVHWPARGLVYARAVSLSQLDYYLDTAHDAVGA